MAKSWPAYLAVLIHWTTQAVVKPDLSSACQVQTITHDKITFAAGEHLLTSHQFLVACHDSAKSSME